MPVRRPTRKPVLTARTADPRALYEAAVQCTEAEIDFVDRWFAKLRGRRAVRLREDFCAYAATTCEWVRRRKNNVGVGVDIDGSALAWSRKNHLPKLTPDQQARITLLKQDVRTPGVRGGKMDVVLACNFSYWIFKTRPALLEYFRSVHRSLNRDGILYMDAFGGWEAGKEMSERRRCRGFTYIWDHASHNPITGDITCFIHFEFKDGTRLNRAFRYDWRLWTLPEIRELLAEAGFKRTTVYWEGDNRAGGGNGVFRPSTRGEACASWVAWLTAEK